LLYVEAVLTPCSGWVQKKAVTVKVGWGGVHSVVLQWEWARWLRSWFGSKQVSADVT